MGNGYQDIYITNGANKNTIGGGNVIAFSGGAGVLVGNDVSHPVNPPTADTAAGNGNAILSNSIFGNAAAGIVLGPSGSPNLNQAAPVFTATPIISNTGQLTNLQGTLTSTANTSFTIQFFASNVADHPSQGRNFLGSISVMTNGSGNASFGPLTITPLKSVTFGQIITATATSSANNSSPFSNGKAANQFPEQTVGVFDPSTGNWYLRNSNSAGGPNIGPFAYGAPGWYPVVGDWNGDGVTTIGVVDLATETWYLRNSNSAGAPSYTPFQFGAPGWIPVVGDWTGTGHTGIGVFDPSTGTWYLRNEVSAGGADAGSFQFGGAGWKPVVGDWTGAGQGHHRRGRSLDRNLVSHATATAAARRTSPRFSLALPAGSRWPATGTAPATAASASSTAPAPPGICATRSAAAVPTRASFRYGGGGWGYVVGDWDYPALPQLAAGGEAAVPSGAAPLTEGQLQSEVRWP